MRKVLMIVIGAGLLLAVGWFAGRMMSSGHMDHAAMGDNTDVSSEREILYWVAPMDANFRRDEPGKSPMGMDLVPYYADQAANNSSSYPNADVSISPTVVKNLGVRTSVVEAAPMARRVETVGYTGWDESTLTMVHPRAEGWLEVFNIDSVGDTVQAGQILFEVFSPKLVSAQREYLTARRTGNQGLIRASRDRLASLGLTAVQITELQRRGKVMERLPYRATRDATVTEINAREGMFVMPMTNIAALADLSTIWVDVEVFANDAAWMQQGLPATAEFAAYPNDTWVGEVAYVYPELDAATRTLRLRLAFDNADGRLRPNMFANVTIEAEPRQNILQVPREAVIRSGAGSRVLVALGNGSFKVAAVKTGVVNRERIEIKQGLKVGQRVVTSGQFLLDAEANGEQAMARLNAAAGTVAGVGQIDEILPNNKVTLTHEPIPELGWPTMTMDFMLPKNVQVEASQVGVPIEFSMRKTDDGQWELLSFESRGMSENSMDSQSTIAHASPTMQRPTQTQTQRQTLTSATVVSVDHEQQRIKLDHEDIASLSMSAMTMTFKVAPDITLKSFRTGDAVRFSVELLPGQGMTITHMEQNP